ncbi:MAG: phage major capsid protein, partial [Nocardioidaceae bacterium]
MSSNSNRPPREVVRAMFPGPELREEGSGATLFGHFATFDDWTEINSKVEGRFMERVAPGAFSKAFQSPQRERVKVLFQHGKDPAVGEQPIASISELRQDRTGAYYEADLLDGVPPLVVSGLRAGQYGASWRFRVTREDFNAKAERSTHNPEGIPERTIREAELYEFGPVTFPAYPTATAGIRSMTDDYLRDILIPVAPSDGAGAEPHPEPERSTEPEPPPEGAEPPKAQDPPNGGSSDSKEKQRMDPVSRTDRPARISELEAEIKTINRENEGVLPADVQARWDTLTADLKDLKAAERAYNERLVVVDSFATSEAHTEPGGSDARTYTPPNITRDRIRNIYDLGEHRTISRNPEHENQLLNDSAMRAVEAARFPMDHVDKARAADQVDRLVRGDPSGEIARRILTTGSPAYRSFFHKYLAGGWHTAEEQRAAAMTSLTGSTGGYATVWELDPTILPTSNGAVNPYRRIAKVVQTTTNEWRGVTSTGVVAAYVGEAVAATEQGPTLIQPAAIVQKAHTYITFSIEAGEDINNLDAQLGTMISDAKDVLEAAQFSTGVGTTTFPQGIMVGATNTFN